MVQKVFVTYNQVCLAWGGRSCQIRRPLRMHPRDDVGLTLSQVHKLCQASAERILSDFQPNLMIAIGGGGYVPARILR